MPQTRLLLALVVNIAAGATTYRCAPPPGTPLCQFPNKVDVAFIGTATATNYDASADVSTWYRFEVHERLAGLREDQKEVVAWISLGSGAVEIGRKYFVDAQRDSSTSRYYMTSCGNTRPVDQADADIEYLRKRSAGAFRPYISGSVLKNYTGSQYATDSVYRIRGIEGASILIQREGRSLPLLTDPQGAFRMSDVAPGEYALIATAPGYVQREPWKVHVPAGGCGIAQIGLFTSASLSGVVLRHDGTPAARVPIDLVDADPEFENPSAMSEDWETNARGEFSITGLPSGRFLLGVNIDRCERYPNATPPTYYPGVTKRTGSFVIELRPNEALTGLTLKLPPPRKLRTVRVRLLWPDGSAPSKASVDAWMNRGIYQSQYEMRDGTLELNLMQGVDYWITAAAPDAKRRWVYAENYRLKAGDDNSTIVLTPTFQEPQWHRAISPQRRDRNRGKDASQ